MKGYLANLRAKANARYTCQECEASEFIQAHHQMPNDDNSIIVLCAACHSNHHPTVPRALFFSKSHQPYWYNKSAASLARDLGRNSRTIIRWAKQLNIGAGELAKCQEMQLVHLLRKRKKEPIPPGKTRRIIEIVGGEMPETTTPAYRCARCSHVWVARGDRKPTICPKCKTPYWDRERERKPGTK